MKKIKNSIYLFIIFMAIAFFSSLGFSLMESIITDKVTNGTYENKEAITFNINKLNSIENHKFIKIIKSINNIYIEKNNCELGSYTGKAIYYNKSINATPNIIKGRFFNNNDFKSDEPKAVVGKDVYNKIVIEKNNEKYIKYNNNLYKIVGIMGYKDRRSTVDSQFYINLNSYINKSNKIIYTKNLCINNNENYKKLTKKMKDEFKGVEFKKKSNKNNDDLSSFSQIYIIILIVILVIFMNVINVVLQWTESKKKEIGIKKALGATNFRIALEIVGENQKISSIAYIFGYSIYLIIIKTKFISILGTKVYFIGSFIAFIFSSLIALIVSLIAILKILKMKPFIIMKGGK